MSKLHIKIGLLVLLAFFATCMEADSSLYEIVYIPNKTHQSWMRIGSFFIVFVSGLSFLWILLSDYFHTFENTIEIIFDTFFIKSDLRNRDATFRVSLYKKYEFGEFSWYFQYKKRNLMYRLFRRLHLITKYFSMFSTFSEHYKNKASKLEGRRLDYGYSYLLCFRRYGYENGELLSNITTQAVKVDANKKIYRLFVGKIFEADELITTALNNNNINEIVKNIQQPDESDVAAYIELMKKTPLENFDKLLAIGKLKKLDPTTGNLVDLAQTEFDELKNFMLKTNTLAYDLFTINNGVHSNHFVGFKVIKFGKTWGVVMIDALQPSGNNFYDFIDVSQNDNTYNELWLKTMMLSFSKILSNLVERRNE